MNRPLPCVASVGALVLVAAACATGAPQSRSGEGLAPTAQGPVDGSRGPYTAADVHFMSGMIAHHAQAVLIAGWALSHGAGPAVRTLSERVSVSQRDEIAFMQRWLAERGEPVPPADPRGLVLPGSHHPVPMPGMLTAEQFEQLEAARGPEFDRLFLTLMIQHHRGAITMVDELLHTEGAAQDGQAFRFAADVHADQIAEIDRMTRLLAALPAAR